MSFDYQWTCPEIDRTILQMKEVVEDQVREIIIEQNPILNGVSYSLIPQDVLRQCKEHAESLSDEVADLFENLRSLNEDMRSSANTQIEGLQGEIDDLTTQVSELQAEVANAR
tara:strand:+ start:722 stop:1060 length:339 start_codon:yes stop_codon:yes gene_type:complete